MSDAPEQPKVVSLFGGAVACDRKTMFCEEVGKWFDRYVEAHGHEPDGIAFGMVSLKGGTAISWAVEGELKQAAGLVLARVGACITDASIKRPADPD